jgi:hypothetical protein
MVRGNDQENAVEVGGIETSRFQVIAPVLPIPQSPAVQ